MSFSVSSWERYQWNRWHSERVEFSWNCTEPYYSALFNYICVPLHLKVAAFLLLRRFILYAYIDCLDCIDCIDVCVWIMCGWKMCGCCMDAFIISSSEFVCDIYINEVVGRRFFIYMYRCLRYLSYFFVWEIWDR